MKKLLLSVSALVIAMGTVLAQSTITGFDYNFTSTATGANNCLLNGATFANVVYANGDGAGNTGVTMGSDNSYQITSDAASTAFNSQSQMAAGYAVNPILIDIYRIVGSGPSAQCSPFRGTTHINMGQHKKVKVVAKASAPMRLRFELGDAFASATNQNANVFEMNVTTSYQEFTFDYAGKFAGYDSTKINLFRLKFNVGDPNASTTGFTGTVNIASVKFGSAADAGTVTSANVNELVANQIGVYPNPATDKVTIDLSSLKGNAAVKLLNTSGAVVSEVQGVAGAASFNVEGLAKGMYFVQISSEDRIIRKKVMVE